MSQLMCEKEDAIKINFRIKHSKRLVIERLISDATSRSHKSTNERIAIEKKSMSKEVEQSMKPRNWKPKSKAADATKLKPM